MNEYDVIIVGAGVAGASAAYHLTNQQQQQLSLPTTTTTTTTTNDATTTLRILVVDAGPNAGEGTSTRHSGSAVMNESVAPTIKMMTQMFATNSQTFISHHGMVGVERYLRATAQGLMWQKEIAKTVLDDPTRQLRELGSVYVGYKDDHAELQAEYELLKQVSCCSDVEWYDKERLERVPGCPPDFECGIYFPRDAIIDSSSYAKGLLRYCQSAGTTTVLYDATVSRIDDDDNNDGNGATVHLTSSSSQFTCRHVVVATGGLWQVPELNGILKPCYSYLVHVDTHQSPFATETSSNFWTWGYSHDWCFTNGKVRNSGEDHFSAYKDPKTSERCGNLIRWTLEKYQCAPLDSYDDIPQQHGIYSETPDYVPIVGSIKKNGSLCYLLGCNAFGQSVLSYTSGLVPALLGFRALTEEEKDIMELFTVRRFTQLPG